MWLPLTVVEVKPGSDFGAGARVLLPVRATADGDGYRPTTSRRKAGNLRITTEEDRTTLAVSLVATMARADKDTQRTGAQ